MCQCARVGLFNRFSILMIFFIILIIIFLAESEKDDKSRRTVKHVLHVGMDGLHHDCWQNASGGVPNFLRLANGKSIPTITNTNCDCAVTGLICLCQ